MNLIRWEFEDIYVLLRKLPATNGRNVNSTSGSASRGKRYRRLRSNVAVQFETTFVFSCSPLLAERKRQRFFYDRDNARRGVSSLQLARLRRRSLFKCQNDQRGWKFPFKLQSMELIIFRVNFVRNCSVKTQEALP